MKEIIQGRRKKGREGWKERERGRERKQERNRQKEGKGKGREGRKILI